MVAVTTFLYLFPIFLYPAGQGMYLLLWTKIQSVGILDSTSGPQAQMSSYNY